MWKSQNTRYIFVPRIETLGNGQVPLCAAVAFVWGFEILRVIVGGNEIGLRM